MRSLVVAVVVWCSLGLGIARADEAADREEARKEFTAGQAADRQKDWQLAIEHYLRANDLLPHPNAMFNIATDYERLGKLREAAVWYQRYVDAAQDSPDRDRVVRTLRELSARSGTLTIRSIPSGARVLVDGAFVGVTPYSGPAKGGGHRIVLESEGQRTERNVKIEYGEPAMLDVTLQDGSGTLRVEGTPVGALVTVDNRPAGSLPVTLSLPPGVHRVRVSMYGYAPFDTLSAISPNKETAVNAQLGHALGEIESAPPKMQFGYLFGIGGGADLKGEGGLFMLEFGARVTQYDASVRIGKTIGLTAIDLLVRWALTKARVAPFVAFGYSFVAAGGTGASGTGYALLGGLRFDVSRSERHSLSVIAESGIRYYGGLTTSVPGEAPTRDSGLVVPFMASLLVSYR
ncbi:MAG: TonB-dependent receptor [Deltaproteobacteria bacterium]|nr:TonB-dependent receptor [Deltaproteobacteria bacterium]